MGLGSGIRDPGYGKNYSGFRIQVQGSKRHRIPDPDQQHSCIVDCNRQTVLEERGLPTLISYGVRRTASCWAVRSSGLVVRALLWRRERATDGARLDSSYPSNPTRRRLFKIQFTRKLVLCAVLPIHETLVRIRIQIRIRILLFLSVTFKT